MCISRKSILGRGNSKCKVLEAGAYSREASVAAGEADKREMRAEEQFNLLLCSSGKKKKIHLMTLDAFIMLLFKRFIPKLKDKAFCISRAHLP